MAADLPSVSVYRIAPGSLVVLRDVHLPLPVGADGEMIEDVTVEAEMVAELVRACGHDQFTILSIVGDSHAELIGPQELRERLRIALDAAEPAG